MLTAIKKVELKDGRSAIIHEAELPGDVKTREDGPGQDVAKFFDQKKYVMASIEGRPFQLLSRSKIAPAVKAKSRDVIQSLGIAV